MRKQNKNTQTKTTRNKTTKASLVKSSTEKWLASNGSTPKTVHLTLQRTAQGYTIENASFLRKINQHRAVSVPADIRAIIKDLNKRGLYNNI
jgi:hypothetical protein